MRDAVKRLRSLRVSDAMTKDVLQISSSLRMSEVADQFANHDVSSAPVIDDQGRCVGMLSAADFLKRDGESRDTGEQTWTSNEHRLQQATDSESLQIVPVSEDLVESFMTRGVQTISSKESLLKAAIVMNAKHIHRLPVLDEQQRVEGLISTMDIVAALVNAIDEMDTSLLKQLKN